MTPAQARAFLHSARQFQLADSTAPPHSPIARAYFRAIEWTPPSDAIANRGSMSLPPVGSPPDETSGAIADVMDVLLEAGVLPQQPRALLGGSQEHARYPALLQAHVQFARDAGEGVYSMRAEEFAFLVNAILASQGAENRLCAAGFRSRRRSRPVVDQTYSYLSATSGSTSAALRAGPQHAASVVAPNTPETTAKVVGSVGATS